MVKIVLVEDTPIHQHYLSSIISQQEGLTCLEVIADGKTALSRIPLLNPDIVMIDIGLPDMSGIECIARLKAKYPRIKFMVCTIHEEDELVFEALKYGAESYLLKKSKPYQIIDALMELQNGGAPMSSDISSKLLASLRKKLAGSAPFKKIRKDQLAPHKVTDEGVEMNVKLSVKQDQILQHLAKGYTYAEIAEMLFVSVTTIKSHIHAAYKKLHAGNRTEALIKYFGQTNFIGKIESPGRDGPANESEPG